MCHPTLMRSRGQRGYTLIELAIVVIIIGLLIAPMATAYSIKRKKDEIALTERNVALVSRAIGGFRATTGRYPCPAIPSMNRDDDDYGHEACPADVAVPAGTCNADGLCVENAIAARLVTNPGLTVRVGMVPFRLLGLSEETAYDGYRNKMTYAVTETLLDPDTFAVGGGGVEIVDGTAPGISLLTPPGSADFVIVSHGESGAGARNAIGTISEPCPDAAVLESENCNANGVAVYRQAETSKGRNNNFFDDKIEYFARGENTEWLMSETTPGNVYFKNFDNPNAGVGLWTSTNIDDQVKVSGIARARDSLKVDNLCAFDVNDGTFKCTQASVVAGDPDAGTGGMRCPAGQYMIGISNNAPECAAEVFDTCPDGQILSGAVGSQINCIDPPVIPPPPRACPSQNVNLCGSNQTLLAGPHGTFRDILAGASRRQRFECVDGSWISRSITGTCACTPTIENRNRACNTGYAGTIYETRNMTCPAGTWSGWTQLPATNCVCTGAYETRNAACQSGYTGNIRQERTYTCTSATTGTWTAWTNIVGGNSCICTPRSESRTTACTGALSGSITETRNFACPAATWGNWAQTGGGCICDASRRDERVEACPSGFEGDGIRYRRNVVCPAGTWGDWVEISRSCRAIPPVVCTWKENGTFQEQTFRGGPRVGDSCTCGAVGACHDILGGGFYNNYSRCNCQ